MNLLCVDKIIIVLYWCDCHTQSADVYEYNYHCGFRLVVSKDTILCTWISWTSSQHVVLFLFHSDRLFLLWYLHSHSTHVILDGGKWGNTCLNNNKKLFYMVKVYLFGYVPSSLCSNSWIPLLEPEDEGIIFLQNNGEYVHNGTV